ncbi:MAG: PIG-L deacetylase family protein [Candidatus Velamenicoccus archaeovorus]
MDDLGTILGVFAHPDDETYLMAGLAARAVRNGSRVVIVTATRGEGGSFDEERWPSATLGEVRERELLRSLAILGVTEHRWLDLPDIDMETALPDEGYEKVRDLMAEIQPDTVLCFGPDGMTDHEAHKSTCQWATRAFHEVAKSGAKLFYATTTPEWAERWVPIYNRFDVFRPGTPPVTAREELGIDFQLPPDLLELKIKAIQEHQSQVEGMVAAFGEDIFRGAMAEETYRLAAVKA